MKNIFMLVFAMAFVSSYASEVQFKIGKKKKEDVKVEHLLNKDTVFVRDTVYLASEKSAQYQARTIVYDEKTKAAFDEDVDSLLSQWGTGFVADTDTFLKSSLSPVVSDSLYGARLNKMAEKMVIEMPFNTIVKAHIKVYTDRKREHSAGILGKMDYYMPIFEAELDRAGLPIELRAVPIIESALRPRAYSRAGASGLWQFIYSTGKAYGLEMNSYIDERRDPYKSTKSAVRFLEDLYGIYNDWFLVIAAYNCGPGNVNKAIRRSGGKRDYWAIYYYLPRETRGYVPAFIAANYLMQYADEHNIKPMPNNLPSMTDTVNVTKPLNLNQVAQVLNQDIELLRDLNPQFRLDLIPAGSSSYVLNLPATTSSDYVIMEDSIMAYKRDEYVDKKRTSVTPGSKYYASSHVVPKGKVALTYTVKSGDNLGFIADWFDVRVSDLRNWNNIYRNLIRVNQKLVVYVPEGKAHKYKAISTAKKSPKATPSKATTTALTLDQNYEYYQVRRGDNLWVIARRYPGVSAENIKALNKMGNNDIKPGQYLKIKKI